MSMNSIDATKRKGPARVTSDGDASLNAGGAAVPARKAKRARRRGGPPSLLMHAADGYIPAPPYAAFTQDAALSLKEQCIERRGNDESRARKRVWQLRCVENSEDGDVRVLAVVGSTPLFGLAKMIIEAFEIPWPEGRCYVPALTKGWAPSDSYWSVVRHREEGELLAAGLIGMASGIQEHVGRGAPHFPDWRTIKVYHLMRARGDALTYHWPESLCDRFPVVVRLDGIDGDSDRNNHVRTPRLVGASNLPKDDWTSITRKFISNKPAETMLVRPGLTREEINDMGDNLYKVPKFDNQGNVMDEEDYGSLREMHDAVIGPFMECEVSSATPYIPFGEEGDDEDEEEG